MTFSELCAAILAAHAELDDAYAASVLRGDTRAATRLARQYADAEREALAAHGFTRTTFDAELKARVGASWIRRSGLQATHDGRNPCNA